MSAVLAPILLPLAAAALGLLTRRSRASQLALGFAALLGALLASVLLLLGQLNGQPPAVFQLGGYAAPMGISLVADPLSLLFVITCLFVLVFGLLYIAGARDKCVRYPAFIPLFLTLSASLCGGILTGDLFNFFVFAELLVISAAVLTALADDKNGVEAAWKYFYISTLAALMLLGAAALFYAAYGTLNLADLARRIADDPDHLLLRPAAALLLCAMFVKAAIVPFHYWQPDFHTVAPTAVSAMLSGIVVKLGVYGLLRFQNTLFLPLGDLINPLLLLAGFAGILIGGLGATGTHNLKRVLAYSTLAQIGVILVAASFNTFGGLIAALVFAVSHAMLKAAMLMLAGIVASRAPIKSASFDVVTGVGRAMPLVGLLFIVGAMGLVGMPPVSGFVAKFLAVYAASGHPTSAVLLVTLLCLASALTLLYTFRSYARVWWDPLPEGKDPKKYGDAPYAPAALLLTCLAIGLYPAPLTAVAEHTAAYVREPDRYLRAVLVDARQPGGEPLAHHPDPTGPARHHGARP
ncbi:MAG: complex I subunit 5 family protein [Tepidisphaerales bacterium]